MKDKQHISSEDDFPLVVGVDLGGTQIRAAVLRGATLFSRVGLLTGEDTTPDRVIPRMFQAVQQALAEANVTLEQIAGIGIGAPGPLNGRTGIIFSPSNLKSWNNVPLQDIFYQHFHAPIFLENDANAAALAEQMFGAGHGSQEMVYITISTGIGAGVITNGKILTGSVGGAAELGHMSVDWRGPLCNCGNIGCLESLSSGTAIARRANEMISCGQADALRSFALAHAESHLPVDAFTPADNAAGAPNSYVHARMVALAAAAGIPEACAIIATAAEALGAGLVNVIHIFNPEVIILGGGVAQMGALLLEPAQKIVRARTMQVHYESVRIVMADLGSDVGIIGAGALIYYHQ